MVYLRSLLQRTSGWWLPRVVAAAFLFASWSLAPVCAVALADTAAFFVGEDEPMVTIASRRLESARTAPAIATVITGERLREMGIRTVAEALALVPGFHMAQREWGSQPYVRGISEGMLLLYDTVPLNAENSKNIHPLDEDLSLDNVERIEVVRGPGSVLWGADAFAAIVNIVPKAGSRHRGWRVSSRTGGPWGEQQASLGWGEDTGIWNIYLGLSASRTGTWEDSYNVVRFGGGGDDPVPPEERLGSEHLDDSSYLDAVVNFSWQDWLRISGRWSENRRRYVLSETDDSLSWSGEREAPFRFLRMQLKKRMEGSQLRLNTYYNELDMDEQEIDISHSQKSKIYYGELLLDLEFNRNQGLLTLGASYKHTRTTGAVVSKGFLPDFLQPDNTLFIPHITQENIDSSLWSLFTQVRHKIGRFDAWAGIRLDDHDQYSATLTHNVGIGWHYSSALLCKFIYGSAFRTPYNQQLVGTSDLDPEMVQNLSFNLSWSPSRRLSADLTLFWNKLRRHTLEDPYGGLSKAGSEDIYGMEAEISAQLTRSLGLSFQTAAFSQYGDRERYKVLDFVIIRPDGTMIPHYNSWSTPFDTGPANVVSAELRYTPWEKGRLTLKGRYESAYSVYFGQGEEKASYPPLWLVDAAFTQSGVILPGLDIQVSVKNLFDRRYKVPGTYSSIKGTPFSLFVTVSYTF